MSGFMIQIQRTLTDSDNIRLYFTSYVHCIIFELVFLAVIIMTMIMAA